MRQFQAVLAWLGRVLWTIIRSRFTWIAIAIAVAIYFINNHLPATIMILVGSYVVFAGVNVARKNWRKWWVAPIALIVGLSFLAIGFAAICEDLNPHSARSSRCSAP